MLHIVGPIELNEHVVLTCTQVLVFLPDITIHTLLAVTVDELFLLSIRILDLRDDQAHIAIVVIDVAIEASVIRLVDSQVGVAAGSIHLEANETERVKLMACLEEGVLVVVIDAAELDAAEVLEHVLLAHEEGAIISV